MAFKDYVGALLSGGLPQVLDYGAGAGNSQGDTRPEYTAPSGTIVDQDNATRVVGSPYVLDGKTIAIGIGGVLIVGLILYVAIRATAR